MQVTLRDRERSFTLDAGGLIVAPGEAVALTGASGTGKTCLLELVGLLRRPDTGVSYALSDGSGNTQDVGQLWQGSPAPIAELRGRAFGFVPQSGGLLGFLTLAENIALSQRISNRPDPRWIDTLAARLGLTEVMDLYPDALSIGQRQRGTIARALAHCPALVVADEPTAALDPETADEAMRLIVEAAHISGSAVLISSHDLALVGRHTARGYRLMLAPGEPGHVFSRLTQGDSEEAA